MAAPLIAIAGSVNPARQDYNPPLRDPDVAKQAAADLGAALARAGCRILVYSRDPAFIEADIVRGYVATGLARPDSIIVRYPAAVYDGKGIRFAEEATNKPAFKIEKDTNPRWEVSYYRSLREVDGVLLMGGAQAVLITGILAQAYNIPLVPVAAFGGSAQTVWSLPVETLAGPDDRNLMGYDGWDSGIADRLVQSFDRQRARIAVDAAARAQAARARSRQWTARATVAGLVLLAAVALTVFGTFGEVTTKLAFGAIFYVTPMVAGAAGGLARTLYDYVNGRTPDDSRSSPISASLGMAAGLVSALLFALAQRATNQSASDPSTLAALVPFELLIGFVAGLTLEAVFTKLRAMDVTNTKPIAAGGP
jgi:hypothetical protein